MPMIVLDPGHGGQDPVGKSTPLGNRGAAGSVEKALNLELCKKVAKHLGDQAVLTRDGDFNVSIAERIDVARRYGARALISVHAAHRDPGTVGSEVWVHSDAGAASLRLAHNIARCMRENGDGTARVASGPLAVLAPSRYGAGQAACLIEFGNINNPDFVSWLRYGGIDALAAQIASGAVGSAFLAVEGDPAHFRKHVIGIPDEHAKAFAEVSKRRHCALITRAVGPAVRQLLQQGYDVKGFRIHGKSCDWGPMAGFVMADPRLSKKGAAGKSGQANAHYAAFKDRSHKIKQFDADAQGWKADVVPLQLHPQRVPWLLNARNAGGRLFVDPDGDALPSRGTILIGGEKLNCYHGRAVHRSVGDDGPVELTLPYVLIEEAPLCEPGEVRGPVWGVYIDTRARTFNQQDPSGRLADFGAMDRYERAAKAGLEPLLAMTNPPGHRAHPRPALRERDDPNDFRNAVCGDYDLFAVWPLKNEYQHERRDRRFLGTQWGWKHRRHFDELEARFMANQGIAPNSAAGTKIGNLTERTIMVAQSLNSRIGTVACLDDQDPDTRHGAVPHRNVCLHSDEGGRPFVQDVDLPTLAFVDGVEHPIASLADFQGFIDRCDKLGYQILLNDGWVDDPANGQSQGPGQWNEAAMNQRLPKDYAKYVPSWQTDPNDSPIPISRLVTLPKLINE